MAGTRLLKLLSLGTGVKDPTVEASEIDVPCGYCGAPTAVGYANEFLFQVCTQCEPIYDRDGSLAVATADYGRLLFVSILDPAGIEERTPEEIYKAGVIRDTRKAVMLMSGVCSRCSGTVESRVNLCEDHDTSPGNLCSNCGFRRSINPQFTCTVCKFMSFPARSLLTGLHPDVIGFYVDHDVKISGLTDPDSIVRTARGYERRRLSLPQSIRHGFESRYGGMGTNSLSRTMER